MTELDSYQESEQDKRVKQANKSQVSGELAIQITAGDTNASNKFVQINYQWLLFIVRKKFRSSNNHEDIVQDSFILVITHLQQGKILDLKAVLAYLRTTAINIGFDYLRKDSKYVSSLSQELIDAIEDAKNDVLSTMIWNDKVKLAKQVLSELTVQRDKDILDRYYFQERTKSSICDELGLDSIHFDRVLYRAKNRLRELIQKRNNTSQSNKFNSSFKKKLNSNSNLNNILLLSSTFNFLAYFQNIDILTRAFSLLIIASSFCSSFIQKLSHLQVVSYCKGVRNESL